MKTFSKFVNFLALSLSITVFSCSNNVIENEGEENNSGEVIGEEEMSKLKVTIGSGSFDIDLIECETTTALIDHIHQNDNSLTISMSDYGGFEKTGYLGTNLPTNNVQTNTTRGDVVIYQSNTIVIFYDENSWSYTKIGRVSEEYINTFEDVLVSGSYDVTFSVI